MFDKLYFKHGTFYIVTDDPTDIPPLKLIISSGIFLTSGPTDELKRLPTDKDMRVIDTAEAKKLFGDRAQRLDGVTVRQVHVVLYVHVLICDPHSGWPMIQNNCA